MHRAAPAAHLPQSPRHSWRNRRWGARGGPRRRPTPSRSLAPRRRLRRPRAPQLEGHHQASKPFAGAGRRGRTQRAHAPGRLRHLSPPDPAPASPPTSAPPLRGAGPRRARSTPIRSRNA
eukprot:8973638-Pyramimonas_sp.AAC.1